MLEDYSPVENDYPPGNPNLPFGYLAGLVAWLSHNKNSWNVFSYKDLDINPHQNDTELLNEFNDWHLKHLDDKKKHILLQYDVDARSDVTLAMARVHIKSNVPANIMIFNRRIWDKVYKQTGEVKFDDSYKLDFGLLREFSETGGVVGYHCNVWERSFFNIKKAKELFLKDIDELRAKIDMEFFSMHGGPTDKNGKSNAHIHELKDFAADLGLTWVHNGRSPSFHRMWDDGGVGHKNYRYRTGDVSETISMVENGNRCRLLFHPQYYRCFDTKLLKNENQKGMSWYEDMIKLRTIASDDSFFNYIERKLINYKDRIKNNIRNLQEEIKTEKINLKKIFKGKSTSLKKASKYTIPKDVWYFAEYRTFTDFIKKEKSSQSTWYQEEYWPNRYSKQREVDPLIKKCIDEAGVDNKPIFIHGMSRSGTTLMNALLDVHPDISMSYELYPNYLTGHGDVIEKQIDFSSLSYLLRNLSKDEVYNLLQEEKGTYLDFIRYLAVAGHSDLSPRDIGNLLREYLKIYNNIHTYEDSLRFVGVCASLKMNRLGKKVWGAKSQGKFDKYKLVWPEAKFIYMLRDGRDILASQLNTGNFNPDVEKVAKAWTSKIKTFNNLVKDKKINGFVVKYEELAKNTEDTLKKLFNKLEIEFHENSLNHSDHDISLLHEPRGQLSAEQVSKPIDTSSIGRWKKDLDEKSIKKFNSIAHKELEDYGYD